MCTHPLADTQTHNLENKVHHKNKTVRNVGADFTGINGFPVVEIQYPGQQTEHVLARSAAGQGDVLSR